jgi:predicted AAA+ superfamily ATPase
MFNRMQYGKLCARLKEPRRFMQVLSGARQMGKTTLVFCGNTRGVSACIA